MTFPDTDESAERDDRFNGLVAAYLEALAGGEQPLKSDWLQRHPDFAVELREFFESWDAISELARPLREEQARLRALTDEAQPRPAGLPRVNVLAGPPSFDSPLPREYELLQVLGRGGMGVVYKARHRVLNRFVALKMIREGRLASDSEMRRFQNEAESVAVLDHPHIVPIFELGEHQGRAWFTMKLIEGGSLADSLEPFTHEPRRAAELMVKVARAVDHAHQRGILHRDLKPSNVLLDGEGEPHVTDFGLARQLATESTLTGTGDMVGTPAYMSPEQASGQRNAITVATDVYGLGAVLYTLLTGRPPFQADSVVETLRQVCEQNPAAPHSLNPRVPRTLETICLKALDKSPAHRYPTAAALADDLQRFLQGRSIQARIAPRRERILRWTRRNPAWAALIAVVAIASLLSITGLAMHSRRLAGMNTQLAASALTAERLQHAAEASEQRARQLLYQADMKLAFQAWSSRDLPRATELLEHHRPQTTDPDLRGFEWHYLWNLIHLRPAKAEQQPTVTIETARPLYWVCYSRGGGGLATAGADAVIRIYDAHTLQERFAIPTGQGEVNGITFSPDGVLIASAGDDGTVRLWDYENGREQLTIDAHPDKAYQVAFMGTGILSCGNDPVIRFWNPTTGERIASFERHTGPVESISGDGSNRFVSASGDGTSSLWDPRKQQGQPPRFTWTRAGDKVLCVAYDPPNQRAAIGARNGALQVWGRYGEIHLIARHLDPVHSVAWNRAGNTLASGDRAGTICLWNVPPTPAQADAVPTPLGWRGHSGRVYSLAFSTAGTELASVGSDGRLKIWDLEQREAGVLDLGWHDTRLVSGTSLLFGARPVALMLWDADTKKTVAALGEPDSLSIVAVSADGSRCGAGCKDGSLTVWDVRSRQVVAQWPVEAPVLRLALSSDGRLAAIQLKGQDLIRVLDVSSGQRLAEFETSAIREMAFSPDGSLLVVNRGNDVVLWPAHGRGPPEKLQGHSSSVSSFAFSPDGRSLASVGDDRQIVLWDLPTRREKFALSGHNAAINSVAFSPDGRTLVTAAIDGSLRLWNVATAQGICELPVPPLYAANGIGRVEFSSDGRRLVCHNGSLLIFDTGPRSAVPER